MTNKPMLSVERELLESFAAYVADSPNAVMRARATELRALLDAPDGWRPCSPELLESGVDCATAPRWSSKDWDGHSHWHPAPAAQHQGEPIYQLRNTKLGCVWRDADFEAYASAAKLLDYERRVMYAEQPAPVVVAVDAEILERFPEINFANYGQYEVEALQAWAFEAYEAIARLNGVKP